MAQQICFMVMPFGVKPTGLEPGTGPVKVDFDALWNKAFKPLIEQLGYTPFRADADTGALIIQEMIERLAYADIVVADVSIPNANVYYEIGVRHAARSTGCGLLSAHWAQPVFDLAQMRRLTYPLNTESIGDSDAKIIKKALLEGIESMAEEESPVLHIVPGISTLDVDLNAVDARRDQMFDEQKVLQFRDKLERIKKLKARMDTVRGMAPDSESTVGRKRAACLEIRDEIESQSKVTNSIRIELMRLLRDCGEWSDVLDYIVNFMPPALKKNPTIEEQRLLALSHTTSEEESIAHLDMLVKTAGPTSERFGLIGGRYKRLYQKAKDSGQEKDAKRYLNRAIEFYEKGMTQDLNDYYPVSNLPPLLRIRNREGDLQKAQFAGSLTVAACQRAIQLGMADQWLPQTMLQNAIELEDVASFEQCVDTLLDENHAQWNLESTLSNIRLRIQTIEDADKKKRFTELANELES